MDASWFRIVTLVFLIIASSGLLVMVVSLLGICGVWAKLFGKSGTERTLPAVPTEPREPTEPIRYNTLDLLPIEWVKIQPDCTESGSG